MKRILLVDDHAMFRESLAMALALRLKGSQVDHVETGQEALAAIDAVGTEGGRGYDIVLLDFALADMTGQALFELLRERNPDQPLAMLSGSTRAADLSWAMEHGANGFIPKSFRIDMLAAILELLEVGGRYFPDIRVIERLGPSPHSHGLRPRPAEPAADPLPGGPVERIDRAAQGAVAQLSARQTQILALVANGLSNKEVARELDILEGTVKAHLKSVMAKMNARNRTQLAIAAHAAGMGAAAMGRTGPGGGPLPGREGQLGSR